MIVFENIDAPENAKYFTLTFEDDVTNTRTTHVGTLKDFDVTQNFKEKDKEVQRLEEEHIKASNMADRYCVKYGMLKNRLEKLNGRYIDLQRENERLKTEVSLLKDLLRDTIRDLKEV